MEDDLDSLPELLVVGDELHPFDHVGVGDAGYVLDGFIGAIAIDGVAFPIINPDAYDVHVELIRVKEEYYARAMWWEKDRQVTISDGGYEAMSREIKSFQIIM